MKMHTLQNTVEDQQPLYTIHTGRDWALRATFESKSLAESVAAHPNFIARHTSENTLNPSKENYVGVHLEKTIGFDELVQLSESRDIEDKSTECGVINSHNGKVLIYHTEDVAFIKECLADLELQIKQDNDQTVVLEEKDTQAHQVASVLHGKATPDINPKEIKASHFSPATKKESAKKISAADSLTEKIILSIENGTAPWIEPWDAPVYTPQNGTTGKAYRGANVMGLLSADFQDPRWATYKQAKKEGWQVRKGEKANKIFYYGTRDVEVECPMGGEPTIEKRPYFTSASVFNFSQIDGTPELNMPSNIDEVGNVSDEVRDIFNTIVENSGAVIKTGYRIAAYSPSEDVIYMPDRERFESEVHYMSSLLHELGHWTGHADRLGREMGTSRSSPEYAIEELKAEMGSVFIAAKLGIPLQLDNHSSYVAQYLEALNDDPKMIWKAAKEAELLGDYVLSLHPDFRLEIKSERDAINAQHIEAGAPPELLELDGLDFSADDFAPSSPPTP